MELDNFKYNLRNLKKCDQAWNEMKPANDGRHCLKCDKTIIDFSNMSFAEIAIFMSERKHPVCGFYLPEQLQQINFSKKSWPLTLSFSTLVATTSVSNTILPNKPCYENLSAKKEENNLFFENQTKIEAKITDTVNIYGSVQYFDSAKKINQPISFAVVMIKGTKNGVTTDANGDFKLSYPFANDSGSIILVTTSIGYITVETKIYLNGQKEKRLNSTVLEKSNNQIIEYYVVVRKRSKWNKFWRKITKPFRRVYR